MSDYIYSIYETTNLINNKIYIGAHKTKDPNDCYMGSGKIIKRAISKHGASNFKTVILHLCQNEQEMYQLEHTIVNEEFITRDDTYNIRVGGKGGFTKEQAHRGRKRVNEIINLSECARKGGTKTRDLKLGIHADGYINPGNFKNNAIHQQRVSMLSRTPEAIQKKRNTFATINHQQKEKNSQWGKYWIHNMLLERSMLVRQVDGEEYLKNGWVKGRKLKF